jgi:AcrR family transcriptional regulator
MTHSELEIKDRILKQSYELFNKFGFHKVTMQEIANSMGMSKKTLYKFFEGKEQIIREIIENKKCDIDNYLEKLWADENLDFVEKISSMMNFIRTQLPNMRGPLFEDLKKNIPEIYNEITESRKKYIREKYSRLIREGIKKGSVRKDLDEEVVMLVYINAIHNILVPEVLSELPLTAEQVFDTIVTTLFLGIFTDEGRQKYQKHLIDQQQISNN